MMQWALGVTLVTFLVPLVVGQTATEPSQSLTLYMKLFKHKRQDQLAAVKSVMKISDPEKQNKMVDKLVVTMVQVLKRSKAEMESSGFVPGMPFPEDPTVQDSLSGILENVAFFSDFALRLPDLISKMYKSDRELESLINWAISFSNNSGFYDPTTVELMRLVAQELNLTERDPDYINPFRKEKKRPLEEPKAKVKPKVKKEKKKGPKISGRHEL